MKKFYILGLLLGLICSFGQPPFNFVLPSLCSLALFFYFIYTFERTTQAVIFSFCFGYGYCFYSHHWLIESLMAYGDLFLWLVPFALFLIPVVFAPYFALAGYLIRKIAHKNVLVIALIWIITEYMRSYGYIESPWLLIGYIWSGSENISQSVSLFGIWGLSYLTIIWAGAFYHLILSFDNPKYCTTILLALISYTACDFYGENHLKSSLVIQKTKIRIIQPNIDNNVYSRINNRYENFQKLMNLSKDAQDKKINFIIWPEGSHEFDLSPHFLELVREIIPLKSYLILNASRKETSPLKHWNSMFVIDSFGNVVDSYDKKHLVAFGEYIPLRKYLPFIQKLTPGAIDYSKGVSSKAMQVIPSFLPSICYEDAFPEYTDQKFTWIINLTNDGWFGTSIGPYQHLAIAKFRAIEHGVPMVRAALTGISAIIDSFGNIIESTGLLKEAVIDATLPAYIKHFTYYHIYNYYSVMLLIIISLAVDKFIRKQLSNYSSIFK